MLHLTIVFLSLFSLGTAYVVEWRIEDVHSIRWPYDVRTNVFTPLGSASKVQLRMDIHDPILVDGGTRRMPLFLCNSDKLNGFQGRVIVRTLENYQFETTVNVTRRRCQFLGGVLPAAITSARKLVDAEGGVEARVCLRPLTGGDCDWSINGVVPVFTHEFFDRPIPLYGSTVQNASLEFRGQDFTRVPFSRMVSRHLTVGACNWELEVNYNHGRPAVEEQLCTPFVVRVRCSVMADSTDVRTCHAFASLEVVAADGTWFGLADGQGRNATLSTGQWLELELCGDKRLTEITVPHVRVNVSVYGGPFDNYTAAAGKVEVLSPMFGEGSPLELLPRSIHGRGNWSLSVGDVARRPQGVAYTNVIALMEHQLQWSVKVHSARTSKRHANVTISLSLHNVGRRPCRTGSFVQAGDGDQSVRTEHKLIMRHVRSGEMLQLSELTLFRHPTAEPIFLTVDLVIARPSTYAEIEIPIVMRTLEPPEGGIQTQRHPQLIDYSMDPWALDTDPDDMPLNTETEEEQRARLKSGDGRRWSSEPHVVVGDGLEMRGALRETEAGIMALPDLRTLFLERHGMTVDELAHDMLNGKHDDWLGRCFELGIVPLMDNEDKRDNRSLRYFVGKVRDDCNVIYQYFHLIDQGQLQWAGTSYDLAGVATAPEFANAGLEILMRARVRLPAPLRGLLITLRLCTRESCTTLYFSLMLVAVAFLAVYLLRERLLDPKSAAASSSARAGKKAKQMHARRDRGGSFSVDASGSSAARRKGPPGLSGNGGMMTAPSASGSGGGTLPLPATTANLLALTADNVVVDMDDGSSASRSSSLATPEMPTAEEQAAVAVTHRADDATSSPRTPGSATKHVSGSKNARRQPPKRLQRATSVQNNSAAPDADEPRVCVVPFGDADGDAADTADKQPGSAPHTPQKQAAVQQRPRAITLASGAIPSLASAEPTSMVPASPPESPRPAGGAMGRGGSPAGRGAGGGIDGVGGSGPVGGEEREHGSSKTLAAEAVQLADEPVARTVVSAAAAAADNALARPTSERGSEVVATAAPAAAGAPAVAGKKEKNRNKKRGADGQSSDGPPARPPIITPGTAAATASGKAAATAAAAVTSGPAHHRTSPPAPVPAPASLTATSVTSAATPTPVSTEGSRPSSPTLHAQESLDSLGSAKDGLSDTPPPLLDDKRTAAAAALAPGKASWSPARSLTSGGSTPTPVTPTPNTAAAAADTGAGAGANKRQRAGKGGKGAATSPTCEPAAATTPTTPDRVDAAARARSDGAGGAGGAAASVAAAAASAAASPALSGTPARGDDGKAVPHQQRHRRGGSGGSGGSGDANGSLNFSGGALAPAVVGAAGGGGKQAKRTPVEERAAAALVEETAAKLAAVVGAEAMKGAKQGKGAANDQSKGGKRRKGDDSVQGHAALDTSGPGASVAVAAAAAAPAGTPTSTPSTPGGPTTPAARARRSGGSAGCSVGGSLNAVPEDSPTANEPPAELNASDSSGRRTGRNKSTSFGSSGGGSGGSAGDKTGRKMSEASDATVGSGGSVDSGPAISAVTAAKMRTSPAVGVSPKQKMSMMDVVTVEGPMEPLLPPRMPMALSPLGSPRTPMMSSGLGLMTSTPPLPVDEEAVAVETISGFVLPPERTQLETVDDSAPSPRNAGMSPGNTPSMGKGKRPSVHGPASHPPKTTRTTPRASPTTPAKSAAASRRISSDLYNVPQFYMGESLLPKRNTPISETVSFAEPVPAELPLRNQRVNSGELRKDVPARLIDPSSSNSSHNSSPRGASGHPVGLPGDEQSMTSTRQRRNVSEPTEPPAVKVAAAKPSVAAEPLPPYVIEMAKKRVHDMQGAQETWPNEAPASPAAHPGRVMAGERRHAPAAQQAVDYSTYDFGAPAARTRSPAQQGPARAAHPGLGLVMPSPPSSLPSAPAQPGANARQRTVGRYQQPHVPVEREREAPPAAEAFLDDVQRYLTKHYQVLYSPHPPPHPGTPPRHRDDQFPAGAPTTPSHQQLTFDMAKDVALHLHEKEVQQRLLRDRQHHQQQQHQPQQHQQPYQSHQPPRHAAPPHQAPHDLHHSAPQHQLQPQHQQFPPARGRGRNDGGTPGRQQQQQQQQHGAAPAGGYGHTSLGRNSSSTPVLSSAPQYQPPPPIALPAGAGRDAAPQARYTPGTPHAVRTPGEGGSRRDAMGGGGMSRSSSVPVLPPGFALMERTHLPPGVDSVTQVAAPFEAVDQDDNDTFGATSAYSGNDSLHHRPNGGWPELPSFFAPAPEGPARDDLFEPLETDGDDPMAAPIDEEWNEPGGREWAARPGGGGRLFNLWDVPSEASHFKQQPGSPSSPSGLSRHRSVDSAAQFLPRQLSSNESTGGDRYPSAGWSPEIVPFERLTLTRSQSVVEPKSAPLLAELNASSARYEPRVTKPHPTTPSHAEANN